MQDKILTRLADWQSDQSVIKSIRETVFVHEQQVDPELEWDGLDASCLHAVAQPAQGPVVATGRLQPDGKIGRMAVLKEWRQRGIGQAILNQLLAAARSQNMQDVYLHAQSHALIFYRRSGFVACGDEFDEAGIPHRLMRLNLSNNHE